MHHIYGSRRALFAAASCVAALQISPVAARADTVNGAGLPLQSNGAAAGTGWTLTQDGYVGTYVKLSQPTALSVSALATGAASSGVSPQMTFVVANSRKSFTISPLETDTYTSSTPTLAAGTYLVRAQLDNQTATATPTLTISSLTISGSGVTVDNTNSDANALAAATTYANNYRSGAATVTLVDQTGHPLPAGVAAHVALVRNAFNFAVSVSGQSPNSSNATWLDYNVNTGQYTPPAPGTPEAIYQQAVIQNFNTLVPANAGKWQNNEFTPGSLQMQLVDAITQFAVENNLAIRMHKLIWDTQQPTWEDANCVAATADPTDALKTRETIESAITSRIGYYVSQNNVPLATPRGANYQEMDVLNEPVHGMGAGKTDRYQALLGASGVADVYQQVQTAEANAGRNTLLCTNEYNVVNTSTDPSSPTGAADPYANWFLREILLLNNAGAGHVVTGTGSECYTFYSADAPSLSAATMTQAMQNLSVAGNRFVLTEFGISTSTPVTPSAATFAADLTTALTVTYGNPDAVTFGFWGGLGGVDAATPTSLYDANWNITPVGQAYQKWQAQYQTSLDLTTNSAGALAFTGTYGMYRLTVNGQNYPLSIAPGATTVTATVPVAGDLTSLVGLRFSGLRFDRAHGLFHQTATLTNNGAAALAGPLYLVLDGLTPGVGLSDSAGKTADTSPVGSPYVSSASGLAPNASVSLDLAFYNPRRLPLAYTPRVLAGPGAP